MPILCSGRGSAVAREVFLRNKDLPELEKIGVARLSVGSGTCRAALAVLREVAQELLTKGTYNAMLRNPLPSAEVNQMLQGKMSLISG